MAQGDEPGELLMDLEMAFESAQGRRGAPLDLQVVRPLAAADVPALVASAAPVVTLKRVSSAHHRLAQLLAKGSSNAEAALLTGYDVAYISKIKSDPTFRELLTTYKEERQLVFVDVLERMKSLAIASLEELQQRLELEPEKWSKRELMDFAELCIGPSVAPKGAGGTGGTEVHINVDFHQASAPKGPVFDGKAEVVR